MSGQEAHEKRCRRSYCRYFCLSVTYNRHLFEAWGFGRGKWDLLASKPQPTMDIKKYIPEHISRGLIKVNPFSKTKYDKATELFTCEHLDLNSKCIIYKPRPSMCRVFASTDKCEYHACEMSLLRKQ